MKGRRRGERKSEALSTFAAAAAAAERGEPSVDKIYAGGVRRGSSSSGTARPACSIGRSSLTMHEHRLSARATRRVRDH